MAQLDALKPVDGLEAQRSETLAWLTTEHEVEMQAFVHQHLLSMLSPFSQRLKDLQDEIEACRDDLNRKAEQLKHTDTVVKQHGQELMTLTMDVNQAHAAVGGLRQELLPEISKKIDEHKVEDEFVEVRQKLKRLQTDLSSNQEVQARVDAELRDLQAIQRKTSSAVAEVTGELHGLRESNDFLSHCYSGISGRVEQAKRVADDTQSAFSKFQHTATNQLEDLKKNGLPRLSSRIDSLEAKQRTLAKEAQADVESLAQVKLQVAHLTTALASLDESVQEGQRVDTAQTSLVHEESINRRGKLERINTKVDETKAELTELAQTLHSDLSRRINDLAVLLDTKSHTIRSNTAAIRTVESGLNALGSDVRSSTAKIGEQGIVQERLVEQARVAETEIHSLFDFRKEAMTKLQEHDAACTRLDLRLQSVDRDVQSNAKNLSGLTSEFVSTQGDVHILAERLEVAHDFLRGVGKGFQDAHKQVDAAPGRLHQEKPSMLPLLPSNMQAPRPSTAPTRRPQ